MKVICVMVISIDGKTTQDNNPQIYHWSSLEDQKYFFSLIEKHTLLIMGRNTYENAKPMMQHTPGKLRVIITNTPQKYAPEALPGMLEFSDNTPTKLLKELEEKGYKKALLLGGAYTNSQFFKENCVDELWLTVEPYLFGKGKPLVGEELIDKHLELISIKKLNKKGTLLLKYKILK